MYTYDLVDINLKVHSDAFIFFNLSNFIVLSVRSTRLGMPSKTMSSLNLQRKM